MVVVNATKAVEKQYGLSEDGRQDISRTTGSNISEDHFVLEVGEETP